MHRISCRGLIIHNKHILLVKHDSSHEGFWCLPGGKIEYEDNLIRCTIRELKEELGVEAQIDELSFVNQYRYIENQKQKFGVDFIFSVQNAKDFLVRSSATHSHEIAEKKRFSLEALQDINFLPKQIISHITNPKREKNKTTIIDL